MSRIAAGLLGVVLCISVILGWSSPGYGFEAREQLNINTATVEELQEVPGITMALAQNIAAYRNAHGPFAALDDLLHVEGMDAEILAKARMHLTIESQTHLE